MPLRFDQVEVAADFDGSVDLLEDLSVLALAAEGLSREDAVKLEQLVEYGFEVSAALVRVEIFLEEPEELLPDLLLGRLPLP